MKTFPLADRIKETECLNIYIQLCQGSNRDAFMYRSCKGRKDYTGGPNRWMKWSTLANHTEQAIFLFSGVTV